jgi:hypothetical protein
MGAAGVFFLMLRCMSDAHELLPVLYRLVASAIVVEVLVLFIMSEHDPTDTQDDAALWVVNRTSLCFVVFSLVDLAKTLGCRLLALRVNSASLFELLKVLPRSRTLPDFLDLLQLLQWNATACSFSCHRWSPMKCSLQ